MKLLNSLKTWFTAKKLSISMHDLMIGTSECLFVNMLETILLAYRKLSQDDKNYIKEEYNKYDKRTKLRIGSNSTWYKKITVTKKLGIFATKKTLRITQDIINKINQKKDASAELNDFKSLLINLQDIVYMDILGDCQYTIGTKLENETICAKYNNNEVIYLLVSNKELNKDFDLNTPTQIIYYTEQSANNFFNKLKTIYARKNHTLTETNDGRKFTSKIDIDPNDLKIIVNAYTPRLFEKI